MPERITSSIYKPPMPRLTLAPPAGAIRFGKSSREFSYGEFIRFQELPLNIIEIKPESFKVYDENCWEPTDGLFYFERAGELKIKSWVLRSLSEKLGPLGTAIQFHFPENVAGQKLNAGILKHHNMIISIFSETARAARGIGISPNITMHLPTIRWYSGSGIEDTPEGIKQALENTNHLFRKLSAERAEGRWPITLGVENQPSPNARTKCLGYATEHFETALRDTPEWINFTVDTGHAKLSRLGIEEDIAPLAKRMGKRIINIHLHENSGRQSEDLHGDEHRLPEVRQISSYANLLSRAVVERIPVVLELSEDAESSGKLESVSREIRNLMDRIEKERMER